jgi:hypothetical protein
MEKHETRLLVIDNLKNTSGSVDENSGEMGNVMANLRLLTENTGAATVVIHHPRKSSSKESRQGENLRGHGSIEAAVDLALHIDRKKNSPTITVTATKVRGADVSPFAAEFSYEHKTGTTELFKARFWGSPTAKTISDNEVTEAIMDVVSEYGPINQTSLVDRVKKILPQIGQNKVRMLLEDLVESEQMNLTVGNNNAKMYCVGA